MTQKKVNKRYSKKFFFFFWEKSKQSSAVFCADLRNHNFTLISLLVFKLCWKTSRKTRSKMSQSHNRKSLNFWMPFILIPFNKSSQFSIMLCIKRLSNTYFKQKFFYWELFRIWHIKRTIPGVLHELFDLLCRTHKSKSGIFNLQKS